MDRMAPTLHFMCDKMAAGKSTLSRRLAEQHEAVLICEDIRLQQLYPTADGGRRRRPLSAGSSHVHAGQAGCSDCDRAPARR